MDAQFYQMIRIAHLGLTFATLAIISVCIIVMMNWPAIRGRGLIIGSLALSAAANLGALVLSLVQFAPSFGILRGIAVSPLIQIGYQFMYLASLVGGLVLLVGLSTLGHELTVLLEQFEAMRASRVPPPFK